jgi:protein involved in polysaccharide export with SLBB domain
MHRLLRLSIALLLAWPSGRCAADLGQLDPAARPDTRIGPHFVVALDVSLRGIGEEELCKAFPVDKDGRIQLTVGDAPIDKILVSGLTSRQAADRIRAAILRYFAVTPEVHAGIAKIPRLKVTVNGATFRQGSVTLVQGARLQDALAETGFQPNADLAGIQITRLETDNTRTTLRPDFSQAVQGSLDERNNPLLQNGDVILIPLSAAPVVIKQIQIAGAVGREGTYTLSSGMTVRDALDRAQGLHATADPNDITILQLRTGRRSVVSYERVQANAPTDNLPLHEDDVIIVGRKDTGRKYSVTGAVKLPQTFEFKGKPTLKQAIDSCGGLKPEADARNVLLMRNMLQDPNHARQIQVDYDKLSRGGADDVLLEPGDLISVPPRKHQQSPLLQLGLFFLRRFLPF